MRSISFCTTCKGRLWQLKQTLPLNMERLQEGCDIVILDYQSNDGLREWLFETFVQEIEQGKLKYFLLKNDYNFSCAYAKNVVHKLSTGTVMFNLDADNYITANLINQIRLLTNRTIFTPKLGYKSEGSYGRLGYTRVAFFANNGYNETIVGMGGDDGDFITRGLGLGLRMKVAQDAHQAIQNTVEQKELYTNVKDLSHPPVDYPTHYGRAIIEDRHGVMFEI